MVLVLLALNALGLIGVASIQWSHIRWVRREFNKNSLAHRKMIQWMPKKAPLPFLLVPEYAKRTRVWPFRQEAPEPSDWCDDFDGTRPSWMVD